MRWSFLLCRHGPTNTGSKAKQKGFLSRKSDLGSNLLCFNGRLKYETISGSFFRSWLLCFPFSDTSTQLNDGWMCRLIKKMEKEWKSELSKFRHESIKFFPSKERVSFGPVKKVTPKKGLKRQNGSQQKVAVILCHAMIRIEIRKRFHSSRMWKRPTKRHFFRFS